MKISDIASFLSDLAPASDAESYDNTGLLIGNPEDEATAALCCHDLSNDILNEAQDLGANLIVCHHPPIFQGIKKVVATDPNSSLIYRAIRMGISVYSTHTALDNQIHGGNSLTAEKLGIRNTQILKPQSGTLMKIYSYCPPSHIDQVKDAIFRSGGGNIGKYSECSFEVLGKGSFKPEDGSDPFSGEQGIRQEEQELKFEVLFEKKHRSRILKALFKAHPYEEVAYEIIQLENQNQDVGSGLIGDLEQAMAADAFLKMLKERLNLKVIKHNKVVSEKIQKVAICGGSGSFLLDAAISAGADAFVTGDLGYHRFFDSNGRILLCDAGHYESEQFVKEVLYKVLMENFANFAVHLAKTETNPVNYF